MNTDNQSHHTTHRSRTSSRSHNVHRTTHTPTHAPSHAASRVHGHQSTHQANPSATHHSNSSNSHGHQNGSHSTQHGPDRNDTFHDDHHPQGSIPDFNHSLADSKAGKQGSYHAKGSGYYPANNSMEGGTKDRKGHKLNTLQDFLAGKAPYVSVAMDSKSGIPYGQKVSIPELEKKYGRKIEFRVVDTGGAFRGKGTSRIDICVNNHRATLDPTINGPLTLNFD